MYHKRYCECYEHIAPQPEHSTTSRKRPYSAIDDDDFEQMVSSLPTDATMNEYDAYMNAP